MVISKRLIKRYKHVDHNQLNSSQNSELVRKMLYFK